MSFNVVIFLKICILFVLHTAYSQTSAFVYSTDKECDNENDTCVNFKDCPSVYQKITHGISPELSNILKKLNCGYDGYEPRVCCSIETIPDTTDQQPSAIMTSENATGITNTTETMNMTETVNRSLTTMSTTIKITSTPTMTVTSTTLNVINKKIQEDLPLTDSIEISNNTDDNRMSNDNNNNNNNDNNNTDNCDVTEHPNYKLLPIKLCGPIVTTDKISNGNVTGLSQYPWMALIQYQTKTKLSFKCGGSLITDRYILTAAHCVTDLFISKIVSIRLGEHDTEKERDCEITEDGEEICALPVQDIPVEKIIIHPRYNNLKFRNDIALIRLKQPANFTYNVAPVCLPSTLKLQTIKLRKLTVSGWGTTETGYASPILLEANVPYVPNEECQRIFGRKIRITSGHMCAGGERGIDSCQGDSGGPLVYPGVVLRQQYIQYGIVSTGGLTCTADTVTPGVYTKVSHYMKWIMDQLEN